MSKFEIVEVYSIREGESRQNEQLIGQFSEQRLKIDNKIFHDHLSKCRFCFQAMPLNTIEMRSITESPLEILRLLTGVEIRKNPELSTNICTKCISFFSSIDKYRVNAGNLQNRYYDFMEMDDISESEVSSQMSASNVSLPTDSDDDYEFNGSKKGLDSVNDHPSTSSETQSQPLGSRNNQSYISQQVNKLRCMRCKQTFVDEISLKLHCCINKHKYIKDSSKSYTCPLCENVMHKYCKKQHQQIHIKPFSCNICGMTFSRKQLLVSHITSNHTKSEFKCSKCPKSFKSQYRLLRHSQRLHGKRIKCHECDAEFHKHHLLQEHVQVRHEGKRWHCSFPRCTNNSTRRSDARRHLRKVHKLDTADSTDTFLKYCKMIKLQ